jgi:hypothetical protein
MDIVFVVDDSGSMAEEQSNLATNFPMFATLLQNYTNADGKKVDFRIGITTTGRTIDYTISLGGTSLPYHEDGDNGAFRNNCGGASRWLDSSDPSMASSLGCRANVGTTGPGIEMPLLMAKYALSERAGDTNANFVRPDALLAIVMITDENDSSTTQNNFTMSATGSSPTNFNAADEVAFLDTLKGNRTRWAAAAIAGDGDCTSSFGDAVDATRLKEFVTLANANGTTQATFSSICEGNLTTGLMQALATFQTACGGVIF